MYRCTCTYMLVNVCVAHLFRGVVILFLKIAANQTWESAHNLGIWEDTHACAYDMHVCIWHTCMYTWHTCVYVTHMHVHVTHMCVDATSHIGRDIHHTSVCMQYVCMYVYVYIYIYVCMYIQCGGSIMEKCQQPASNTCMCMLHITPIQTTQTQYTHTHTHIYIYVYIFTTPHPRKVQVTVCQTLDKLTTAFACREYMYVRCLCCKDRNRTHAAHVSETPLHKMHGIESSIYAV